MDGEITGLHCAIVALPTRRLRTSYGTPQATSPHLFLRLDTRDGPSGYAEASPLPYVTGETVEAVRTALCRLREWTIGGSVHRRRTLRRRWEQLPGNHAAKGVLDMATHDAAARASGVALRRLLGGGCAPVPIGQGVSMGEAAAAVQEARAAVAAGARSLKIKVGGDPDRDVEAVRQIRRAVGGQVALRIDANQGYDLPQALYVASALREQRLQYFEQPLRRGCEEAFPEIRAAGAVAIAADESMQGPTDALRLAGARAADVFIVKLIKVGGFAPAADILAIARSAGIRCVLVSPYETALGLACNAAFAQAFTEDLQWPNELLYSVPPAQDPSPGLPVQIAEQGLRTGSQPGAGAIPDVPFEPL